MVSAWAVSVLIFLIFGGARCLSADCSADVVPILVVAACVAWWRLGGCKLYAACGCGLGSVICYVVANLVRVVCRDGVPLLESSRVVAMDKAVEMMELAQSV